MRKPEYAAAWPDSWKESFTYDLLELYHSNSSLGYRYAYRNRSERTFQLIAEVLSPGARILDIAAAQGNFSLKLAEMGYVVTWNDLRSELQEYVQMKHEYGNIEYRPGNALEMEFGELFDLVLVTEVIEHVAHPDEFLSKVSRLVRPGGYVVMTTPNGRYFRNTLPRFSECADPSMYESIQFKPNSDGHIFLLTADEITSLALNAGLTVERLQFFTSILTNGHCKTEFLLKLLPKALVFFCESACQRLPDTLRQRSLLHMAARLRKPVGNHGNR